MIVRMLSAGKSFKGLGQYLTHDPQAETSDRVAWTHTLNLANDHVPSAINEMYLTAENAELLKREAGIRAGGRTNDNPVKHFSLNWAPEENPSRDHMIETAEEFLRHMKWEEHQAILVAHNEKEHSHVHVMLNTIHPETGLKFNEDFEHRRAQKWALGYELEQGKIYCEQRQENAADREDAPTRPAWMAFKEQQKEFEQAENARKELAANSNEPENPNNAEWKMLKDFQRREREAFFAEGKSAFSELRTSIYREIREEFRPRWSEYYDARDGGEDAQRLAEVKAYLVAEQKSVLEERRDAACRELRETRDVTYRELLDGQQEMRLGLQWRQDAGLDSEQFLSSLELPRPEQNLDIGAQFRAAGKEVTERQEEPGRAVAANDDFAGWSRGDSGGVRSGADVGAQISFDAVFALSSIAESLVDGFVGAKPDPKPRQAEQDKPHPDPFQRAAEEARQNAAREKETSDRKWYEEEWSWSRTRD